MKKLPVSCNKDCGGGCPLIAHIEDGRLQRITNNPLKNPYMTGCVRGYQMPKVVYAHDRLTSPLVRTGKRGSGKFSEISWEEGLDPATLQHSNLIILWGANIVDNRFGCEMESRIREARRRGAPVIVIDPRRNRTASRLGTTWIPVQPGTDSVLMAAVLHVLLEEGLFDRVSVDRLSAGFGELEAYIRGKDDGVAKTPEWAERICGTPASLIRELALLYGKTKPAALLPGLSIQRTVGGEEAVRMAAALQVATGNVGVLGGSTGGNVLNKLPQPRCDTIRLHCAYRGPSISVSRWPDAVLGGTADGYPCDIQLIYTVGCNFLSQGSDMHKNIRAFQKAQFSVCHDYFLTPTAQYSDVVFPVTTFLERSDVIFPRSNYLFYSHQVPERYSSTLPSMVRRGSHPPLNAGFWRDRRLSHFGS